MKLYQWISWKSAKFNLFSIQKPVWFSSSQRLFISLIKIKNKPSIYLSQASILIHSNNIIFKKNWIKVGQVFFKVIFLWVRFFTNQIHKIEIFYIIINKKRNIGASINKNARCRFNPMCWLDSRLSYHCLHNQVHYDFQKAWWKNIWSVHDFHTLHCQPCLSPYQHCEVHCYWIWLFRR